MLKHGLREMDGRPIIVPHAAVKRPNPEYLEDRFTRLRAA